jgi:hypothetical protein
MEWVFGIYMARSAWNMGNAIGRTDGKYIRMGILVAESQSTSVVCIGGKTNRNTPIRFAG